MTLAALYKGRRVMVTGHTGFKGAWLSEWLLALGSRVSGLALPPPTDPALFDQLGLASRCDHRIGDIRDAAQVGRVLRDTKPDFVFHLAAQPLVRRSYEQPVETYETNVMGTIHVLEALRSIDWPCAAVIVTTDKVYENREWLYGYRECDPLGGHDPYSSSKAAVEIVVNSWRRSFFAAHPVRIATARAGNVIGGGDWATDRIVPDSVRSLMRDEPIPVRNSDSTRPWQHVLEPLSGYLWLGACLLYGGAGIRQEVPSVDAGGDCVPALSRRAHPASSSGLRRASRALLQKRAAHHPAISDRRTLTSDLCSAFNFGPGDDANRTVRELVEEMIKHWPGRWEDKSGATAVHEAGQLRLAIEKARAMLEWAPVWNFEEAVKQTVNWYRQVDRAETPADVRELTRRQIVEYCARARELGRRWAVDQGW